MRDSLMFPRLHAPGAGIPLRVDGLEEFTRAVERLFYARARVGCTTINGSSVALVLSLECPLGLREVLDAYQNGCWGHQRLEVGQGDECRNLVSLHRELERRSGLELVMEEVSLQCTDCLLVLQKFGDQGAHVDFYPFLHLLGLQDGTFWHSTGGRPVEIFAPVLMANPKKTPENAEDPLRFWAIYRENREEPQIFDACRMREVQGGLTLGLG